MVEGTSQINDNFIKSYNKDSDIAYFHEVDFQYREELHELHNDLPFLLERIKTRKVANFWQACMKKKNIYTHKKFEINIKSWSIIKNVHKVIKFNQKSWLTPFTDMITELRKKQKMILKKIL